MLYLISIPLNCLIWPMYTFISNDPSSLFVYHQTDTFTSNDLSGLFTIDLIFLAITQQLVQQFDHVCTATLPTKETNGPLMVGLFSDV